MNSYALNRLSPYNDMRADVPDQVTLDVYDTLPGERECSGLIYAIIDVASGEVEGLRDWNRKYVSDPDLRREMNEFLATPDGMKALQTEISRVMERG